MPVFHNYAFNGFFGTSLRANIPHIHIHTHTSIFGEQFLKVPWCMSAPRWRRPGMRRAVAEIEGEADGWPAEVLIARILARCWAGEINLQSFSHCGNCWLALDSSVALSHYLSPVISQPFCRSCLCPIPLRSHHQLSPDFSPSLLFYLATQMKPACNNWHFKHNTSTTNACNQADNYILWTAFCVCLPLPSRAVAAVFKGQTVP